VAAPAHNSYVLWETQRNDERRASDELLKRADTSIQKMHIELERLRRAADLYRQRRDGVKRDET
jgi:hypothetical protein